MTALWTPPPEARQYDPPVVGAGWTLIRSGIDGRAYGHEDGRTLIWSVSYEADGHLWRHASMAHPSRLPTWEEMVVLKEWLCGVDAIAYQVIPPIAEYVNDNPNCLHLWEPIGHRPTPDFRKDGTL
jgi:hypothetical protein